MILTQILLWKTIEDNKRLRVRVRVKFLLFYSELVPTARDVTGSRLDLDGKKTRMQFQMNTLRKGNYF